MTIRSEQFIGFQYSQQGTSQFHAMDAATGEKLDIAFYEATLEEADQAVTLAEEAFESENQLTHLEEVITAGEQLQITPAIARCFDQRGGRTLYNHYGPSETHVVTAFPLKEPVKDWP